MHIHIPSIKLKLTDALVERLRCGRNAKELWVSFCHLAFISHLQTYTSTLFRHPELAPAHTLTFMLHLRYCLKHIFLSFAHLVLSYIEITHFSVAFMTPSALSSEPTFPVLSHDYIYLYVYISCWLGLYHILLVSSEHRAVDGHVD